MRGYVAVDKGRFLMFMIGSHDRCRFLSVKGLTLDSLHSGQKDDHLNPHQMKCLIHVERQLIPGLRVHLFPNAHPPEYQPAPVLNEVLSTDQEDLPPLEPGEQERDEINEYVDEANVRLGLLARDHPFVLKDEVTYQMRNKRIHEHFSSLEPWTDS